MADLPTSPALDLWILLLSTLLLLLLLLLADLLTAYHRML